MGKVAVQAKLLAEIVRKMNEDDILLSSEATGSDRLMISTLSNRSTFILKLLQVDEYPLPEQMEQPALFTIRGGRLRDAIRQTLFAVQKENICLHLQGEDGGKGSCVNHDWL